MFDLINLKVNMLSAFCEHIPDVGYEKSYSNIDLKNVSSSTYFLENILIPLSHISLDLRL